MKNLSPRHPKLPAPVLATALLLMTLLAYWPALGSGYIWDDDDYLTHNALVHAWDGLPTIWQPMQTRQYYPLVFTTFWLEHKIWGLEPLGYHLVNVLLHALNAMLIWRIARWLNLPGAWMIAAIFALHPVHVESVAWVTERKNTLSAALYLTAMLAYLKFDHSRESSGRAEWWRYGIALLCFAGALFSKTVTASLPVAIVILLLLRRESLNVRRVWPLAPMLLMGLVLGLNTAHVERVNVGAVGPEFEFSFIERCLIASRALLFYPSKLVAPWPLCFFYERWIINPRHVVQYLPAVVLLVSMIALLVLWKRGARWPACAAAYFGVTIFPALGFVSVYPMRYAFVADHFQYLASLGIIAGFVAPIVWLLRGKPWGITLAALLLITLAAITFRQTLQYKNEETLWRATIRCNPKAWAAMNNLAAVQLRKVDAAIANDRQSDAADALREAESLLRDTLRLKPDHFSARAQLSESLRVQNRIDEAFAEMQRSHADLMRSIEFMNDSQLERAKWSIAESHYQLARLHNLRREHGHAIEHYLQAVSLHRNFPSAYLELAQLFAAQQRMEEAAITYTNLLTVVPVVLEAHRFLGDYHRDVGEYAAALRHYQAIEDGPFDQAEKLRAMDRAARVLATCPDETVRDGVRAIQRAEIVVAATQRQSVFPLQTLAAAYAEAGRFDEAVSTIDAAMRLAAQLDMNEAQSELSAQRELYRSRQPWRVHPPDEGGP